MLWMILKPLFYLPPLIYSPIFSTLFLAPWGRSTWTTDYVNRTPVNKSTNQSETKVFIPSQGLLQSWLSLSNNNHRSSQDSWLQNTAFPSELWYLLFPFYVFLPRDGINLLTVSPGCLCFILTHTSYASSSRTHIFVNYTFCKQTHSTYPTLCVPSVSG